MGSASDVGVGKLECICKKNGGIVIIMIAVDTLRIIAKVGKMFIMFIIVVIVFIVEIVRVELFQIAIYLGEIICIVKVNHSVKEF